MKRNFILKKNLVFVLQSHDNVRERERRGRERLTATRERRGGSEEKPKLATA